LAELKIAVVGIPGNWSTEILADAVERATGFRLVIDMAGACLDLNSGSLRYFDQDLCRLDALIVKKISPRYSPNTLDRLELLRTAEQAGVRVFSRAENMLRLIDRLSCTVTLSNAGIPMPETRITEDVAVAVQAVHDFGSAVFKPLYSTKARGMCVISTGRSPGRIEKAVREFRSNNPMMYIQQKVELPGQDMGMVFLGGEYLGSYARVGSGGAWNTTTHSGGRYAACDPDDEIVELARRAQALFGMDYTTVDVAETPAGPVVFEVSAFGGFRGAHEGLGVNVPARYVEHVLTELGRGRA